MDVPPSPSRAPSLLQPPHATPMALPIHSSPLPPDVAVQGWAAITVRVAWTLLSQRVRPRDEVLRDARDHVLFHLDRTTTLTRAEDLAEHLTRGFVARARRGTLVDPWPLDIEMSLSPRWRRVIDETARPVSAAVFRHHYGYGRPLEELERRLRLDRIVLEEARGGLREIVRQVARDDDLPLDTWPSERIDRLLSRLSAFSIHESPPLDEVADGCHQEWLNRCPRCDRTVRLVRAGVLTSEDLVPPTLGARPNDRVRVLAVHLHPDAKRHRAALAREIGGHAQPLDDDMLLVDDDDAGRVVDILKLAAEVGAPGRDHLRAVRLEGPGRWSRNGLLGPLPEKARGALRSQAWGCVGETEELPAALPPPPSARKFWVAVGALGVGAAAALVWALQPAPPQLSHDLRAEFTEGRGGIWTRFDADEAAQVTVIRQIGDEVDVVLASATAADKAVWATGDGGYRLHTMADGVLLVASGDPLADLGLWLADANGRADALDRLAMRIHEEDPDAAVASFQR